MDGKVYYVTSWLDNKLVNILSTFEPKLGHGKVKLRNGTWTNMDMTRPTIIGDYNSSMGATNLIDQINSTI